MVYESNFLVRKSGKRESSFYIDYMGSYTLETLSKAIGLKDRFIRETYEKYGAVLDVSLAVYYFSSVEKAREAIGEILSTINPADIGKAVYLTSEEIELIRQALINEGVNTIGINNKVKDAIFKKLNNA